MAVLEDSVFIRRKPEVVFGWLLGLAENYGSWHRDHVRADWERGGRFGKGSVLRTEERLGGRLERMRCEVTENRKNEFLGYRFLFPESMICSKGSFSVRPSGEGCVFTAKLHFRFGFLLSLVFPYRAKSIRKHMKEEGENLKKILEKGR